MSEPNPTDEELVKQAQAGSDTAWSQLFQRYQAVVRKLIARIVYDGADHDDLVQDVFLQAFKSLGELRCGSSLAPWLSWIATHKAIDHVRKRKTVNLPADWAGRQITGRPESERASDAVEARDILDKFLESLEDGLERRVVEYFLLDLTIQQIQAREQISYYKARNTRDAVERKLQEFIAERSNEDHDSNLPRN